MRKAFRSSPVTSPGAAAPGRRETRRAGGFTLVELVAVLTIMVIAAAAITPGLVRFLHGAQLQDAARRTAALATEARGVAVARDRTVTMTYDPEAHGVRLTVEPGDMALEEMPGEREGAVESPTVGESPTSDSRLLEFPPEVRFVLTQDTQQVTRSQRPATFLFFGDGRAEGGPVIFEREGFPIITLAVNPRTGRVALRHEGQP